MVIDFTAWIAIFIMAFDIAVDNSSLSYNNIMINVG